MDPNFLENEEKYKEIKKGMSENSGFDLNNFLSLVIC